MKVELFTICEGAFNHRGHLTIINTKDRLSASALPCRISFGIALKFYADPGEVVHKKLAVSVLAPDRSKVFDPEFTTPVDIEGTELASHFAVAINLQNVLFAKFGTHNVHLELDGERFDDFSFEVGERSDV